MTTSMPNMHQFSTFINLHDKPIHRFDCCRQLPSGGEAENINIMYLKAVVANILYNYRSVFVEEKKCAYKLILSCLRIFAFWTIRSWSYFLFTHWVHTFCNSSQ
jgi:hypothetical protein